MSPNATIWAQEEEEQLNLSEDRLFGFDGQLFLHSLSGTFLDERIAFLDSRLWPSPPFGLEGGVGAISIPPIATFPIFMGRVLFKFIDGETMDFYIVGDIATVFIGRGSVHLDFLGSHFNIYLVQIGTELSPSADVVGNVEAGLVLIEGYSRLVVSGGLHFYLPKPEI